MRRRFAALIVAVAVFPFAGSAEARAPADEAADALIACLDIGGDGERLSCLEAATAQIKALRETRDIADAEDEAAPGDLFGAEQLASTQRARREEAQETRLEAGVVEITVGPLKNVTIVLDNGQVWRQLESDRAVIRPHKGDSKLTVSVKKGAVGGYWMTINEISRRIRVKRIK